MEEETTSGGSQVLSPYGIVLLAMALMFDILAGLIVFVFYFFGVGDIVAGIIHFIGFGSFGMWIFFRSGKIAKKGKMGKKIAGKILKRGGLSFLGSVIPFLGKVIPFWTIAVYLELKNG